MNTAQDATALADEIAKWLHDETNHPESYPSHTWPETERDDGQREGGFVKIVPLHGQEYFRDIARRLVARFAALRAPSQTPDAVRAFDTTGTVLRRSCNVFTITCEDGDTANRVADQLRSTPSASAGPQAEAVAMLGGINGVSLVRHIRAMQPAAQAEYHTPLYAHPQPQQADGRGAVIEALERIVVSFQGQADRYAKNCDDPKFDECQKEIWASLANEKLDDLRVLRKALQQSPATGNVTLVQLQGRAAPTSIPSVRTPPAKELK